MKTRFVASKGNIAGLALALLLTMQAGAGVADPGVFGRHQLDLMTTPSLGQTAVAAWLGIPVMSAKTCLVNFQIIPPAGQPARTQTVPVELKAGRVGDAEIDVAFETAGVYTICATTQADVEDGQIAESAQLVLEVPQRGPARRIAEPVITIASAAAPRMEKAAAPSSAPSFGAFTASVTFQYHDKTYNSKGFCGTRHMPVRQGLVKFYRISSRGSSLYKGYAVTDDLGRATKILTGINPGDRLQATLSADSDAVIVQDPLNHIYYYTTPQSGLVVGGDVNMGTFTVDNSAPWNIFDSIQDGYKFAGRMLAKPSHVHVVWAPGYPENYYLSSQNTIYLSGAACDPNEYDDSVILSFYARKLTNHFSYTRIATNDIATWSEAPNAEAAWYFGWTYFLSSAIRNNPLYVNTKAGGVTALNLETPAGNPRGCNTPGAIAAALWDICDTTNDGKDTLSDPNNMLRIWIIWDQDFRLGSKTLNMTGFYLGWLRHLYPNQNKVVQILADHGMNF